MKAVIILTLHAAIGTALPTSPQQDDKSLDRRGRSKVFCELLCGNLWDPNDLEYDLCIEGCVNVAAEPGVPVDLGDIEFRSGKA